jgi:hypothetical protein
MRGLKDLFGAGAVFVVLVLSAVPVSAFTGHAFSTSFGSAGSGAGQLVLASNSGVAVNSSTHDVYVADTGNRRIEEFSSTGTFVRAWGWGVADGLPSFETCTLVCQAGLAGAGSGQLTTPIFVAVDNSAGPSAGDVYVGDVGTNLVQKFDASGDLVAGWGSGGQLDGSAATGGPFTAIAGIALDTSGHLFVYDPNSQNWFEFGQDGTAGATVPFSRGTENVGIDIDGSGNFYKVVGNRNVEKYDSSGNDVGPVDGASSDTGFTIDPTMNDIYIDGGGRSIQRFDSSCVPSGGPSGSPCAAADSFGSGDLAGAAGLGVDSSSLTVYAADVGNQRIAVFTKGLYPDVTTNPAIAVTAIAATVNGHLDPAGGGNVVDCHFQYVDDAAFQAHGYGDPSVLSVPCAEGNSFSTPANVHADLTTLQPVTTYHFRLIAGNAQGQNQGADQTFTTPPAVKDVSTDPATNVQGHSATLNGTLDPNGLDTTYHFQYVDDAAFQASGYSGATSVPVPDADAGSTPGDQSVHTDVTGLQSASTYHFRLIATDSNGTTIGQDEMLTTLPPPSIGSAAAANLTPTSTDLTASINPNGFDTIYRFEWGTSAAYGASVPIPDGHIAAGLSDQAVAQHVSGLQANTTYHFRVVAQNLTGTTTGVDHTFIYDTSGEGLPDNRAYEMITPPQKNGALIGVVFIGSRPDVSEGGSRVIASSVQCFAGSGSCSADRLQEGDPFAFTRTSDGWVTTPLAPPSTQFDINTVERFSADAGTALFSVPTPPAGEDAWYARRSDGSFLDIGPVTPPSAGALGPADDVVAATADLSHIVYSLRGGVVRWPFDPSSESSSYEYVGGGNTAPALVGVSGGAGSTDLISTCGTLQGGVGPGFSYFYNSLSADGGTVYFTAMTAIGGGACLGSGVNAGTPVPADTLYARIDGSRTVLISGRSPLGCVSPACLGSSPSKAEFQGASTDGSRVFFTSTQQLTDDASEGSQNLYEYNFSRPAGENLVAVSAGDSSGEGPQVQGVEAISSDGSHIYFAAKGVLTGVANGQGQVAQGGAENLYMFERDANYPQGRVAFIAALPLSDEEFVVRGEGQPGFVGGVGLANVTPDGRFLVFMSHGRLTSDDTNASGTSQVFRYDAQTGMLVRISIGERGFNDNGNAGVGEASIVPAVNILFHAGAARPDPTMSHDGAFVFFESPTGLMPRALNDVQVATFGGHPEYAENVYEWHEGHVYLVSDGRDTSAVAPVSEVPLGWGLSSVRLLGSDATGANVFFTTADRLVGQDTDTQLDYYDARICTTDDPCVAAPPAPAAPCVGEGCRAALGGTPSLAAPVSATFSGAGNLAAEAKPAVKAKRKAKPKKARKRKKGKRKVAGKRGKAKRSSRSTRRGR